MNEELGRCFEQLPDSPFDDSTDESKLIGFLNFVLQQMKADPLHIPDKKYKAMGLDIFVSRNFMVKPLKCDNFDKEPYGDYETKCVNSILNTIGVNSLRLGGLHMIFPNLDFKCQAIEIGYSLIQFLNILIFNYRPVR